MDPRVISLICVLFAMLGAYNLYTGVRRLRDARRAGKPIRWYKQLSFLTGVEYILLTFYFLLIITNQQGNIAPAMRGLVVPFSLLLLVAAAIIAGFVIRQAILNVRIARASAPREAGPAQATPTTEPERRLSKREQEELAQRQRERRKKAAAARRRRAGKA